MRSQFGRFAVHRALDTLKRVPSSLCEPMPVHWFERPWGRRAGTTATSSPGCASVSRHLERHLSTSLLQKGEIFLRSWSYRIVLSRAYTYWAAKRRDFAGQYRRDVVGTETRVLLGCNTAPCDTERQWIVCLRRVEPGLCRASLGGPMTHRNHRISGCRSDETAH